MKAVMPEIPGHILASRATGIELRGERGGKLTIRIAGQAASQRVLPEQ